MSDETIFPLPEDLLSAYVDDELDPSTRAQVEERLATSPEWRSILDEVRVTRAAVRALTVHEAPVGFWERLPRSVIAADPVTSADGGVSVVPLDDQRRVRSTRLRLAALASAAAAAVIVAVGVVPAQDRARPPVASFSDSHSARSSLTDEPVTQLAGIGRTNGLP